MDDTLVVEACPVCRGERTRSLYPVAGGYRLELCLKCGVRFATPRPDAATLQAFYGEGYFDGHGWLGSTHGDSDYLRQCWAGIRGALSARHPGKGRLLDVGCATGTMLLEARADGWDCVGLEISETAAARARAAGLDVRTGVLGDAALEGQRFDVVCSFHVIEHVLDPVADLAAMRGLVDRGGTLVLETPNARSVGHVMRRGRWAQIKPPEHIQFFDAASMRWGLREAGWKPVREKTIYKRDTAARLARQRTAALVGPAKAAARMAEAFGMGGNLRVIAEAM